MIDSHCLSANSPFKLLLSIQQVPRPYFFSIAFCPTVLHSSQQYSCTLTTT